VLGQFDSESVATVAWAYAEQGQGSATLFKALLQAATTIGFEQFTPSQMAQ
jgi:hypothetical protein